MSKEKGKLKQMFSAKEVKSVDERATMTNRILPKKDFQKVLEHDKIYLDTLNEILEFNVIKQDILGQKAREILENQTRDKIIKNIDLLCEYSEVKLKCLDTKAHIVIQDKLINDKLNHFNQVFLPQWEIESKETEDNFDIVFDKAKNLAEEKPNGSEKIVKLIEDEVYWYEKLTNEQKADVEYKWQLHKPLKRLLAGWEKQDKTTKVSVSE